MVTIQLNPASDSSSLPKNSTKITDGTNLMLVNANGSINVVSAGALPIPGSTQTILTPGESAGTGANKNYATVTAGKTAYIMALIITGTANDSFSLVDNGATTNLITARVLANDTKIINTCCPLAIYTTAQTIKFNCAATTKVSMVYVEV